MSSDDDTPTDSWPTPTDPFFTWGDEEPAPYLPRPVEPAAAVSQALVDVVRKPAPARRLPPWPRPVVAAAAAAAVTVISLIAWWALSGSGPQSDPPQANTAPTTAPGPAPTPTPPPQSQTREFDNRLMALLPAGYPPGACRQAAPPPDALSMVECGANADAPGTSARYTLFAAAQPLADAMTQLIEGMTTQICPGNYASPGPWRKTTTPEIPAGTLVCGATRQGTPSVGWTLDSAMLLAAIEGTRLDQLYTWWSTHS